MTRSIWRFVPPRSSVSLKPRRRQAKSKPFAQVEHCVFGVVSVTSVRWDDSTIPVFDAICADGQRRTLRLSAEYFLDDISALQDLARRATERHLQFVDVGDVEPVGQDADSESSEDPDVTPTPTPTLEEDPTKDSDSGDEIFDAAMAVVSAREDQIVELHEQELAA